MPRTSFTCQLMLGIGMGTALVGYSPLLRRSDPGIAKVMRGTGALLLFASFYLLTFYRHFSDLESEGSAVLPVGFLLLGAAGLVTGGSRLAPESPWFRNRLLVLLGLVLAVSAGALFADLGLLPRGPAMTFFNFGWDRSFDSAEWGFSLAAWAVWFLFALWCVAFGARSGRKGYLNTGVLAVGLGIVTLFFDLIGSLATTGTIFLLGGLVLLGTGWGMERWRRSIVQRMGVVA
ncbi:MAG: hypothetical protein ABIP94_13935 [Planctomycetota bacterium]